MRYHKIIFFLFIFTLASCGKSPLLNKAGKNLNEVTGGVLLSEQFKKEQLGFSLNWIIAPTLDELSSFEFKLERPLKNNQSINVYIWMPEMGHGSSPIEMKQLNSTDYTFSEIAFIMPGLWVLHVEILENNQVVDQWQKSITL
jgi:hypothetical protein